MKFNQIAYFKQRNLTMMTVDRFPLCCNFTLSVEGGYSSDPTDGGNWMNGVVVGSNLGITWKDIKALYGDSFRITPEFMRNITPVMAKKVLRILYWNTTNSGNLWPGLDLVVFDFGFNAGIGISARELQIALGFTGDDVDDDIGPMTAGAAKKINNKEDFLTQLRDAEIAYYMKLPLWQRDGNGWKNRADDRLELAIKMIKDPTLSS